MDKPIQSHPDAAQPRAPAAHLAARLLTRLFFRPAAVIENRQVAAGLHLISLEGAALRDLPWSPGDKLQVRVGTGLLTRTYTPLHWNAAGGSTQILAHALAAGPGSEWARRVLPGDAVSLFGPRRSLALSAFDPQRSVVIGDETALGLAAAWRPSHALIEAINPRAIQDWLDAMHVSGTAMTAQPQGLHLDALANAALGLADADTCFVLVGRASTVQALLRTLRHQGIRSDHLLTKAYWVDGKAGLD